MLIAKNLPDRLPPFSAIRFMGSRASIDRTIGEEDLCKPWHQVATQQKNSKKDTYN